jgi:hypothetical protein
MKKYPTWTVFVFNATFPEVLRVKKFVFLLALNLTTHDAHITHTAHHTSNSQKVQ